MMKVRILPGNRLDDDHVARWTAIRASNPELRSPFFHPHYTREAATVFGNVEVAVLEENGEPVGYFPYQRTRRNVGIPVGGSLNDFQGVIAPAGFVFDPSTLVRECQLAGYRFTQLLASQQPFVRYHWCEADSPSMDLRQGFDAYARQRREAGSTLISRTRDKRRVAVRDLGTLRMDDETTDPAALEALVAWKSKQYARIRAENLLLQPGTLDFLKRLLSLRGEDFRGVLSAMYFGDQLAAVHLGIRAGGLLHLWFPTYNEEMARYSPGNIYFFEQARVAEAIGIDRIDLGCGNEKFKTSFRSFGTTVGEGAVGLGLIAASVQRTWLYTRQWIQSSRIHGPARSIYRSIKGLFLRRSRHDADSRTS